MENITKDLMQFTFSFGEALSNYKNQFNIIKEAHNLYGLNLENEKILTTIISKLYAVHEIMLSFESFIIRPDDDRSFEFYPADEVMALIIDIENFMSVGS